MLPTGLHEPVLGLNTSAEAVDRPLASLQPPSTRTVPWRRRVAAWLARPVLMLPTELQPRLFGSNTSAEEVVSVGAVLLKPPATRTLPLRSSVAGSSVPKP